MTSQNEKLTEHELRIIGETLDYVITKYEQDNNYILQNPSERKFLLYQRNSVFPKTRPCIIPGCKKRSIKNSHTIQKAHSLSLIAEKQHLYVPFFNKKTGQVETKRVGINEASTFPGFCPEHENIFAKFEKVKNIDSEEAIILQIFRTIAREIIIKQSQLSSLIKMKEVYLKFRQKKISGLLAEEIKKKLPYNKTKIDSIKINYTDDKLDIINSKIDSISLDILKFTNTFFDPFYRHIFLNAKESFPFYIVSVHAENQIPVCLSGRANFTISDGGIEHDIPVIINVLPLQNDTRLFIATELLYQKYVDTYISKYQHTALPAINMIESWMVRGSDHWFIKPSVWDEIDLSRQQQILKDILDVNFTIGIEYNYSIFDSLRKSSIDEYIKKTGAIDTELKKKIDIELKKMGFSSV